MSQIEENKQGADVAVAALEEMVQYQDGAVVSNTIIKKPGGTVTLFAFDRGQGLSEHTTPHEAIVYLVEGEAEITIGGRARRVTTGQTLRLPADVPHALEAVRPFKMLLAMVRS